MEKSKEDKNKEFNIQLRILESRKRNYDSEVNTYDNIKTATGQQYIDSYDKTLHQLKARPTNKINLNELIEIDNQIEEET